VLVIGQTHTGVATIPFVRLTFAGDQPPRRGEHLARVAWYIAAAGVVYLLPTLAWRRLAPWSLEPRHEIQAWVWSVAFAVLAMCVTVLGARPRGLRMLEALLIAGICWVSAYALLAGRADVSNSRLVSLLSIALGTVLAIAPFLLRGRASLWSMTLSALTIALVALGVVRTPTPATPTTPQTATLFTALEPIALRYQRLADSSRAKRAGALAVYGDGFVLVTGAGTFYRLRFDSTGGKAADSLRVSRLSMTAPEMGVAEWTRSAGTRPHLKVTGIALDTTTTPASVYIAHERWNAQARCVTQHVSAAVLSTAPAVAGEATRWRTIFSSQPCVPMAPAFDPFESGGRLVRRADGTLLLTLGDYGLLDVRGVDSTGRPSDYGAVHAIAPDGSRSIFTTGHRNAQGLTIDHLGRIWSTEHGPRGGDEINLLRPRGDYGFPGTTYGTQYGSFVWPFTADTAVAARSIPAVHTFVPSIGISNLLEVRGTAFPRWRHDLLIASLIAESLFRVRLVGERVAYAEPIAVGARIRDVAEGADGRIVMWTDDSRLIVASPARNEFAGSMAYDACARCHGLEREGTVLGPPLRDVIGSRVSSDRSFEYSPALKQLGGTWTEERLDAFLKNPSAMVPGTRMAFEGIADSTRRKALISYLRASQQIR